MRLLLFLFLLLSFLSTSNANPLFDGREVLRKTPLNKTLENYTSIKQFSAAKHLEQIGFIDQFSHFPGESKGSTAFSRFDFENKVFQLGSKTYKVKNFNMTPAVEVMLSEVKLCQYELERSTEPKCEKKNSHVDYEIKSKDDTIQIGKNRICAEKTIHFCDRVTAQLFSQAYNLGHSYGVGFVMNLNEKLENIQRAVAGLPPKQQEWHYIDTSDLVEEN